MSSPTSEIPPQDELQQFVHAVSHDLQAPLRAILGFSELLGARLGDRLDDKERHYLEVVQESSSRMQLMLAGLTDFSRLRSRPAACEAVPIAELVERVVRRLRTRIDTAGAQIVWSSLPTLRGDRARLETMIGNLIENGLIYCENSTPRIEILARPIEPSCSEQLWRLTVRDNGIGIDPDHTERIFRVFSRLHTRDEYPGIGMGLAIVKRIVEDHGGSIDVRSNPAGGSDFHVLLPAGSPFIEHAES